MDYTDTLITAKLQKIIHTTDNLHRGYHPKMANNFPQGHMTLIKSEIHPSVIFP